MKNQIKIKYYDRPSRFLSGYFLMIGNKVLKIKPNGEILMNFVEFDANDHLGSLFVNICAIREFWTKNKAIIVALSNK